MILGCKLPDLGLCITSICVPMWTSLAVHWLIVCASTAEGVGSIPGWGTKILHAVWCGRKKKGVCQCAFYSMDRGAWQAAIHGVAKSRTQLSDY